MFAKKTIKDIDVKGKKVLVRVDFNVPLDGDHVADDTRIQAALPTIEYLLSEGAAVILTSHLGRPQGSIDPSLSLKPVAEHLADLIDAKINFGDDCLSEETMQAAKSLPAGEVLVLENTRFHPGEKANDSKMAQRLASMADIFVNDAFGTAHRSHASNVGVSQYLPAVAGFLLEKEIRYLGRTIANPQRPFMAILGGAKVSGKINVIHNLLPKVEKLLIGGGMANTFFKAQGYAMGDSLVEDDVLDVARSLLDEAKDKMMLPVDVVIADDFDAAAEKESMGVGDVPPGWQILDIGEKTLRLYKQEIQKAATVVWNGPMGVFEFERFSYGTFQLAKIIADSDSVSIVGGGDSAAAIRKAGLHNKITHISTGGGASLQMLQGEELPGLEALDDLD